MSRPGPLLLVTLVAVALLAGWVPSALAAPGDLLSADGSVHAPRFLPPGGAEISGGLVASYLEGQQAYLPVLEGAFAIGPGEIALLPSDGGEDLLWRMATHQEARTASGWEAGVSYRPQGAGLPGLPGAGGPFDLARGAGATGLTASYLTGWNLGYLRVNVTPGVTYDPSLNMPHLTLGTAVEHDLKRWVVGGSFYMDERLSDQNVNTIFALGSRYLGAAPWFGWGSLQETLYGNGLTFDSSLLLGVGYRWGT